MLFNVSQKKLKERDYEFVTADKLQNKDLATFKNLFANSTCSKKGTVG
jgi:hypothetical protein